MPFVNYYVVVLPNGVEHFGEIRADTRTLQNDLDRLCQDAIYQAKLTTPRKTPATVECKVFSIILAQGKAVRRSVKSCKVALPLERMTDVEYKEEMKTLLADLPEEFHRYVEHAAYESGHSSGLEEVVNTAGDIVSGLKPCIEKFERRLS